VTSFGAAMRGYLGQGLTAGSAMRATWADVKRGQVARPPRRRGRRESTGLSMPWGRVSGMGRRRSRGNPYTERQLASLLTQLDDREGRHELKRYGRVNIHRIALYLQAADRVRDRVARGEAPGSAFAEEFTPTRGMHTIAKKLGLGLDVQRGQWVRTNHGRQNPLTRKETGMLLKVARDDLRLSHRLPSLTATGRADPRVRERHIGFWRGRADGLLGVVGSLGAPRRRRGAMLRTQRSYRRTSSGRFPRAATLSRLGIGPGLNPPSVVIYDKVLKIFAQKQRGPHKGQRFVHHFRTAPRMLGLPNGDLLITGR
jgi:hypothetical protein